MFQFPGNFPIPVAEGIDPEVFKGLCKGLLPATLFFEVGAFLIGSSVGAAMMAYHILSFMQLVIVAAIRGHNLEPQLKKTKQEFEMVT